MQGVVAGTTQDFVITVTGVNGVVAFTAIQMVIAAEAAQGVVTGQRLDVVGAVPALEVVIAFGAKEGGRGQAMYCGNVPEGAVGELQLFDVVVFVGVPVLDGDLVGVAVADAKHHVLAFAVQRERRGGNAGAELDAVLQPGVAPVEDGVLAIAQVEDIGVARAGVGGAEFVVAGTALEAAAPGDAVIAGAAFEDVVALGIDQGVIAVAAIEFVVTGFAVQGVVAGTAVEGIVAGLAIKGVVASAAEDLVVAGARSKCVVPVVADVQVIFCAALARRAVVDAGFLEFRFQFGAEWLCEQPLNQQGTGVQAGVQQLGLGMVIQVDQVDGGVERVAAVRGLQHGQQRTGVELHAGVTDV